MSHHNINTDTPLVPYIIAEMALWNVLERDVRFKHLEGEEMAAIVAELSPSLVSKAEKIYKANELFRKQIKDKRNDPRYTLEMFMEHWTMGLLLTYKLNSLCTLTTIN